MTKAFRALGFATAASAVILASACGGGAKLAATPTPTAAPTLTPYTTADLTSEQMKAMTLALDEFGPRYATFETTVDAPLAAIAERAYDACNPDSESQALSKYEWVKGYSHGFATLEYGLPDTMGIGTDIDVYSSAEKAGAKLKYDGVAIENDSRGAFGCQGAKIERIEEFPIDDLGDEARGWRVRFSAQGLRGTMTYIEFRRDRIIATVSISRLNSEDSTTEVTDAARKVDEKMMPILTAPVS